MVVMFTVKELRELSFMSQTEFSEATGIPKRTLENWEQGKRNPPEWVMTLLDYFVTHELMKNH